LRRQQIRQLARGPKRVAQNQGGPTLRQHVEPGVGAEALSDARPRLLELVRAELVLGEPEPGPEMADEAMGTVLLMESLICS